MLCQSEGPAATGLVKTSTGVVADDGHSCAQGEIRTLPGAWHGVPKIRALYEATYFAGLRKAGMPEE